MEARPVLRLVNDVAGAARVSMQDRNSPSVAVERANRASAELGREDAREIFAARVAEAIQGGRLALLPPEQRSSLLRVGRVLGLRDFDANLVIAIVQDRARQGEAFAPSTCESLRLIRPPEESVPAVRRVMVAGVGLLLGVGAALLLAGWILAGTAH